MPTFRFVPPQPHHVLLRKDGSRVRAGKTFKEPDEETAGLLAHSNIELVEETPPKQPVDAQPPDRAQRTAPTTT